MTVCPYDALEPANLAFCEQRVCGWIVEPANTWTNVGFLIAGIAILFTPRGRARHLGWIALVTGLASASFHATGTLVGQLFDQSAMFLETSLFIVIDLDRLKPRSQRVRYLVLASSSIILLVTFPTAGIALFTLHSVGFVVLEVVCFARSRARSYRSLIGAWLCFVASFLVWSLDKSGAVCEPQNHVLTLHGVWHLLGAISFALYYRHFRQFDQA